MDSFIGKMMGTNKPRPTVPNPRPTTHPQPAAKGAPRVVRVVDHQRGTTTGARSQRYHALPPGARISKNGKPYHETRANRSHLPR
jgi:hypothetical protein